MSRKRTLAMAALLLGSVALSVGLVLWRAAAGAPGREQLVGVWDIEEAGQKAGAGDEAFRSTERIRLDQDGTFRHIHEIAGVAKITADGVWMVRRTEGDRLIVALHQQKLSVESEKGEPQEKEQD